MDGRPTSSRGNIRISERRVRATHTVEPAAADLRGPRGEVAHRPSQATKTTRELADGLDQLILDHAQSLQDGRQVGRNRSAFVPANLTAAPVEQPEVLVQGKQTSTTKLATNSCRRSTTRWRRWLWSLPVSGSIPSKYARRQQRLQQ